MAVDEGVPERVPGPSGDEDAFEIRLPLLPGDHSVCVTAVNIGSGQDVDLGCVVGTVLPQAPPPQEAGPDWWVTDWREGVPIADSETPPLYAVACVEASEWGEEVTGWLGVFALVGEDGDRVQSPSLPVEETWIEGGGESQLCGLFLWDASRSLHPNVTYTITVQMWFDGANPSAWFEGDSFIAYTSPEERLRSDFASGVLSADDYARYTVYRWFDPALVPEHYQVPEGTQTPDLSATVTDAFAVLDDLDPAVASELRTFFSTDGQDPGDLVPFTEEEAWGAISDFYDAADDMHLGGQIAPAGLVEAPSATTAASVASALRIASDARPAGGAVQLAGGPRPGWGAGVRVLRRPGRRLGPACRVHADL